MPQFVLDSCLRGRMASSKSDPLGSRAHVFRLAGLLLVAAMALLSVSCARTSRLATSAPSLAAVKQEIRNLGFSDFMRASYRLYVLRYPQTVARLGLAAGFGVESDRLDDDSAAYARETVAIEEVLLDRLRSFSRSSLSADEQVAYEVCEWMWSGGVARSALGASSYVFFPGGESPDAELLRFFSNDLAIHDRRDVDNYIACLHQVPQQATQLRARLADQTQRGILPPQSVLQVALLQLDELRAASTSQASDWLPPRNVGTSHPLFLPLRDALAGAPILSVEERKKVVTTVGAYVASDVMPALEHLYEAVADLEPKAKDVALGWSVAAGGSQAYAELVRESSGTSLAPSEIERRALAQMKTSRAEIAELAPTLGLASSASLPDVSAAVEARIADDVARFGLARGTVGARMARACQTLFPTCTLTAPVGESAAAAGGLVLSDVVGWTCDAPNPFVGFLKGFQLYLLQAAGESSPADFPALTLYAQLRLHAAAAEAAVDVGIQTLGWSQADAQRELAAMLELTRSETGVAWGHWRAAVRTVQITDDEAFPDVARIAGSPGKAAAAFAVWSEIARLRNEARRASGASWNESAFLDVLLGHGALPVVVAEKLVDGAFGL